MTWNGAGGVGLMASTTLAATPMPTATAAVAMAVAASAAALAVHTSWDLAWALASPLPRGTKALKGKRGGVRGELLSFRSRVQGNLTKCAASALSRPSC